MEELNLEKRMRAVLEQIAHERYLQFAKWGQQYNHSHEHWLTILAEEFGEAAKEVYENDIDKLEKELVQVAAVAAAWVEAIKALRVYKEKL